MSYELGDNDAVAAQIRLRQRALVDGCGSAPLIGAPAHFTHAQARDYMALAIAAREHKKSIRKGSQ
jgi:hypothetical protein